MGVPPGITEAEYLAIERAAEFKSEFYDGEMFARAGGSPIHSRIATNAAGEFGNRLEGRPCVPFNTDLRLKVEAAGLFTYPDLSVVCGEMKLAEGTDDVLVNPTLILEVFSDSTEAYDRGKKFEMYRQIPSLREYLLASQHEPRLEQFIRQPNGYWLLHQESGLDATLLLPSLAITISLANLYAHVNFLPAPIRPPAPPRK